MERLFTHYRKNHGAISRREPSGEKRKEEIMNGAQSQHVNPCRDRVPPWEAGCQAPIREESGKGRKGRGLSRWIAPVFGIILGLTAQGAVAPAAQGGSLAAPGAQSAAPATQAQASEAYGKLPLFFEANRGQTDPKVKFLSRGSGYGLFLTPTEAVLSLRQGSTGVRQVMERANPRSLTPDSPAFQETVLRMRLLGANPAPQLEGLDPLPSKNHYFIGNDPKKWRTALPTYGRVRYQRVYPGIDLVFYGNQRQLEYDLVVAPGADPKAIRIAFQGADRVGLDAEGNLVLHVAGGRILQHPPRVYQEVDGARREISGRYVLQGKERVGFEIAAYDPARPLVIDPVLSYSTYLGGSSGDSGQDIAVDRDSNAYVTGDTSSTDFPTANPLQSASGGGFNAFITKIQDGGQGVVHDLAVTRINPSNTVILTPRNPSQTRWVMVEIQNRSPHNETIQTREMLDNLVRLEVKSLPPEICPDPTAVLHRGRPQKTLPIALRPKQKLNVVFDLTFDCANDPDKSTPRDPGHEDYRYIATVSHAALEGEQDSHPDDDICPRSVQPPFETDPNPDGTIPDRGCGVPKPDNTFGADVLTDVVVK